MNNSVLLQNYENDDYINYNIHNRNFPSNNLQMNFAPTSVATKYVKLPTIDTRKVTNVISTNHSIYNVENTFFPGNDKPHFCGFANNVDKESTLRNQFFALQKSDQSKYIPSSNSDLYENNNGYLDNKFNKEYVDNFNDFNPNLSNKIGSNLFNNSTRVQLKNI
jgi:hypothetical protein